LLFPRLLNVVLKWGLLFHERRVSDFYWPNPLYVIVVLLGGFR
jgi:hypothetical protein